MCFPETGAIPNVFVVLIWNRSARHHFDFIRNHIINKCKKCTYKIELDSHSRSLSFGTNRKLVCDFLFVNNINLHPISNRLPDIAQYWPNYRFWKGMLLSLTNFCTYFFTPTAVETLLPKSLRWTFSRNWNAALHCQINCWTTLILVLDAVSQRCCAAWQRRLCYRHWTVNQQSGRWRCLTVVSEMLNEAKCSRPRPRPRLRPKCWNVKSNYNRKDHTNFMPSSAILAYFWAVCSCVRDVGSFAKFVNMIYYM